MSARGRSPVVTVEPRRGWLRVDWRELWRFRDLWMTLAVRDIKVRYKQTVLGAAWAVLQPVVAMLIFTVVFGRLMGASTAGYPKPVFYYAGMLPWLFFANTLTGASQSLIEGSRLMTKVYFPRILMPAAVLGYTLLDFALGAVVFLPIMALYGVAPSWRMVFLPVLLVGLVLAAQGVGILIAALNVKYRDFRYVVPFLVQVWFFATPVVYAAEIIPQRYQWIAHLNPMAGLVGGFRACLLGGALAWDRIALSCAVGAVLFLVGVVHFRRVEDEFADIV